MALTWLEICGFRSYAEPQRFDFDGVLTVVDGANSQGKTSTAEDECRSQLTIDGAAVNDPSSIGIVLADPPLRAPVLLQHSLRFALSARPQDRADYFKAVLEVQDLEVLCDLIRAQVDALRAP